MKQPDKALNDRPRISLASTVDWTIGQGWSSRGGVEYYGDQSSSAGDLPAYALWNASVGKRFDQTFSLRAGVNNLTDVRLAEKSANFGYAELGRNLYVTLAPISEAGQLSTPGCDQSLRAFYFVRQK